MADIFYLLSGAFVLYVVVAYPAWMVRRRRREASSPERTRNRTVTVIMAVHNGAALIEAKLRCILNSNYPRECMQILVVSDGSTDGTDEIVSEFASEGVELISVRRGGKARALNAALSRATGEVLMLTDLRQKLHPDCMSHLVARLESPSVGAVSGRLMTASGRNQEEQEIGIYWRVDVAMRQRLSDIHSTFGTNGPCYAIWRHLAVPLPADCLLDDVFLPLAAYFRGYRIVLEERAEYYEYATSLATEFRRKSRTQAGLYQILRWYPQLLLPTHPMWFHFLSSKFLRLLLPHALLVNLVAGLLLPAPWAIFAVLGHALILCLAGMHGWGREGSILKRISSPARTFVVLMASTFAAQAIFFTQPQKLWKVTNVPPSAAPV